jgi:hypothetical protein
VAVGEDMPVKEDPKPEDFVGIWVGRWDGVWQVQITIVQDAETKELSALYEWEERRGQPLKQQRPTAKIEKNTLILGEKLIEMTLSAKEPIKAKAVGNFKRPRTADLIRETE